MGITTTMLQTKKQLTRDDFEGHPTFVKEVPERSQPGYRCLLMQALVIDGRYFTLDQKPIPTETYYVYFQKRT